MVSSYRGHRGLVNSWDISPADDAAVSFPIFAVLPLTALEIASASVEEDDDEEDGVEVRDDGGSADDGAPGEAHDPVGDVVGLAGEGPPSTRQKTVTMCSLNIGGVFDGVPSDSSEPWRCPKCSMRCTERCR